MEEGGDVEGHHPAVVGPHHHVLEDLSLVQEGQGEKGDGGQSRPDVLLGAADVPLVGEAHEGEGAQLEESEGVMPLPRLHLAHEAGEEALVLVGGVAEPPQLALVVGPPQGEVLGAEHGAEQKSRPQGAPKEVGQRPRPERVWQRKRRTAAKVAERAASKQT